MSARIQRRTGRQIIFERPLPADLMHNEGIGLDEVFLLTPGKGGAEVSAASALAEIKEMLEGGVSLPEAIVPLTKPDRADQ